MACQKNKVEGGDGSKHGAVQAGIVFAVSGIFGKYFYRQGNFRKARFFYDFLTVSDGFMSSLIQTVISQSFL